MTQAEVQQQQAQNLLIQGIRDERERAESRQRAWVETTARGESRIKPALTTEEKQQFAVLKALAPFITAKRSNTGIILDLTDISDDNLKDVIAEAIEERVGCEIDDDDFSTLTLTKSAFKSLKQGGVNFNAIFDKKR